MGGHGKWEKCISKRVSLVSQLISQFYHNFATWRPVSGGIMDSPFYFHHLEHSHPLSTKYHILPSQKLLYLLSNTILQYIQNLISYLSHLFIKILISQLLSLFSSLLSSFSLSLFLFIKNNLKKKLSHH